MSSLIFAQTHDTKPPDSQPPVSTSPTQSGASAKALDQLEILTDTMGVDFGPYLTQVVKTIKKTWYDAMPRSVYPPEMKQGRVAVELSIQKDGKIKDMKIHTSSGDIALDRAAWASITASSPFAALPSEFGGQTLGLRLYFYYNAQSITISSAGVVQVAVGATQQFSASGKGITDTSVIWNVSGPGCSKSSCGTISDNGLYTAPADIPNPPKVFIEATARTGTSLPAKVQITIVQANPSH